MDAVFISLIDYTRIPFALVALSLSVILGFATEPLFRKGVPLLWILIDALFGRLGQRLDRLHRPARDLALRGTFFTVVMVLVGLGLGSLAQKLVAAEPLMGMTQIILLFLLISAGTLWSSLLRLYGTLSQKKTASGAYYALAQTTRNDLSGIDDFGITRTGMTYSARLFDKAVVLPLFWYLVGGFVLAVPAAILAALAWRFGKDGFSKGFGNPPLLFEKIAGFIPHYIAALLLVLATFVTPTAGITRSVRGLFKGLGAIRYNEGGLPVAVMAWALNVSLGGPATDLEGSAMKREWVGPTGSTAMLTPAHLKRSVFLCGMATFILMFGLSVVYGL